MTSDPDPTATQEWLDALDSVLEFEGAERATFLLDELVGHARRGGVPAPHSATTPYVNTIPVARAAAVSRGSGAGAPDPVVEPVERGGVCVRRANKESSELGGNIASFQSVGHVVRHGLQPLLARSPGDGHGGDLLFVQGHVLAGDLRAVVPRGAGSARSNCSSSARRWAARGCRRTRTRG